VGLWYSDRVPLPELQLIEHLRRQSRNSRGARGAKNFAHVVTGIGDDCAILRGDSRHDLLVTTDFSLEGVHFRRQWHPPESVGHRCLARGLSDIAAMGGEPTAAFLSLGLPAKTPQKWVDRFMAGFSALARRLGVALAGGDTAESPRAIAADIIVVGRVPRGKAVLRSGAKPGNAIYVTGKLGVSGAVLQELLAGRKPDPKAVVNRPHFFPEPRLAVGEWLRGRGLATAMIDLSDGLSTDLTHICQESGVGAILDSAKLVRHGLLACPERPSKGPRPRPLTLKNVVELELRLHRGEDYELLFTALASAKLPNKIAGVPLTRIGEIIPRNDKQPVLLKSPDGCLRTLAPRGWQHFRKARRS
jgi:thiamine-monophosphate kinase